MSDEPTIPQLIAKWESAKRAWNKDGGPIEKTVKVGEDLYFAGCLLIEALLNEDTAE